MISHAEELAKKDALRRQNFATGHLINGELDGLLVVRCHHCIGNVYVLFKDGDDTMKRYIVQLCDTEDTLKD